MTFVIKARNLLLQIWMKVSVTGLSEREEKIVEDIHAHTWGNQAIIETHLRNAFEVTSQKRQSLINGKKMNYMTEKAGQKKPQKTLEDSSSNIPRSRKAALRNLISFCHNLSFVTILVLSQFEFLSFVTIWVFEFCHKLKILVLAQLEVLSCQNFGFWVLSQFEFKSFVIIWVFKLSHFKFLSFVTIWVFSQFEF